MKDLPEDPEYHRYRNVSTLASPMFIDDRQARSKEIGRQGWAARQHGDVRGTRGARWRPPLELPKTRGFVSSLLGGKGARMLLGAPGIATRNKKLLGAPGLTTSNKKLLEPRIRIQFSFNQNLRGNKILYCQYHDCNH